MTENRVGFLCNVAFNLSPKNDTYKVLRSYYLMRCHKVTKGYGLPPKYFSSKARCPHCYLDWTRDSDVKVHPLKLSKRKRQKLRSQKKPENKKYSEEQSLRNEMVHPLKLSKRKRQKLRSQKKPENKKYSEEQSLRNEMVQKCSFCRRGTKTHLIKPERQYNSTNPKEHTSKANDKKTQHKKTAPNKQERKIISSKPDKKDNVVNLYTKAFDVFSLKNDKNTLASTIKVPPKVIKNNKKKKDKFAGLCQKAVLASAKLKEQKEKQTQQPSQNKLNLFLKPSSG